MLGVTLVRYWNWVVSVCECCVLVLEVCVCKLCLEREKMKQREADPVCLMCALLWCCLCSWMVCFRACFHLLVCVWAVLGVTLVRYWNWVVSGSECCVLVLEVCVCKLCLREREDEAERG